MRRVWIRNSYLFLSKVLGWGATKTILKWQTAFGIINPYRCCVGIYAGMAVECRQLLHFLIGVSRVI